MNKFFKFNQQGRIARDKGIRIKDVFEIIGKSTFEQKVQTINLQSVYPFYNALWLSVFPTVMKELEILKRSCVNANYENFVKKLSNSTIYGKAEVKHLSLFALSLLR